jgi:adenosylcobyric acid synthase
VNLRAADIANMGFADAADVAVVLIGDIDRGGVIAQLVGTWNLLSSRERELTRGFIVNKFRGDPSLFKDGRTIIRDQTGMADYGVVPWFEGAARLPREDSFDVGDVDTQSGTIKIAVPVFSRISNFDDLDPLRAEPDVSVVMVKAGEALPGDADLVILPGSKATLADVSFVCEQGWDIDIAAHVRRGGAVLGICGGYQMLGRTVSDPDGIEGPASEAPGLGLLDIETVLTAEKTLVEVTGTEKRSGAAISGYEMHVGQTRGPGLARPMLNLSGKQDGAVSADGRIAGCYVHGIFSSDTFRSAFLQQIRPGARAALNYEAGIDQALDALADHIEVHLDIAGMIDG